jgi:hypothetical protein
LHLDNRRADPLIGGRSTRSLERSWDASARATPHAQCSAYHPDGLCELSSIAQVTADRIREEFARISRRSDHRLRCPGRRLDHGLPRKNFRPVTLRRTTLFQCRNHDAVPGDGTSSDGARPRPMASFQSYSTRCNSSLTSLAHDANEGDGLFRMMRCCRVG